MNDRLQWVSDLGKMSGVPTPVVDSRIASGSSAIRSAGPTKSTKLTNDEIAYASQTMEEYRADIAKAQTAYEAAKASAEQLAEVTGHKFEDPGKDLTSRAENLNQSLVSWTKALQANNRDAATKARAAAKTAKWRQRYVASSPGTATTRCERNLAPHRVDIAGQDSPA